MPNEGFAPIKSTIHIKLLPYSYTNNDVAQLFERFGKIARVTIMRDKKTRESKGVAWVQFSNVEDAIKAASTMDGFELDKFKIKVDMAKDNGRSGEFIRKRKYTAKKICFECGEVGHYSYDCPKNMLGSREPPEKPQKKSKRRKTSENEDEYLGEENDAWCSSPERVEEVTHIVKEEKETTKKIIEKDGYFSDED